MLKRSMIICFIGIDGSGKSTLSRGLYEELDRRGYDVSYTWWLEGEKSLLRRLVRRARGARYSRLGEATDSSKPNNDKLVKNFIRILYPHIVLLDYLRFGIIKACFPKIFGGNKIIIFDRFMYDILLALCKEFDFSESRKQRLFKIFNKLLPRPDLVFIIDVSPEISYSRKKEEIKSIMNAKVMWEDYQKLYFQMGKLIGCNPVRIDNSGEIIVAQEKILEATLRFLKNERI